MMPAASSHETIATDFFYACMKTKDEHLMRGLTSDTFYISCSWNDGTKVNWSNIEQMIGGFKLIPWVNDRRDIKVLSFTDDTLRTSHEEKKPSSSTYLKVDNVWQFTFNTYGLGLIASIIVETTVHEVQT